MKRIPGVSQEFICNVPPSAIIQVNQLYKPVIWKEYCERKVQLWFEKFRFGDFSLQNVLRGRPKTSMESFESSGFHKGTCCQDWT